MSVKKTGSPLSSGAESIEPLGSKEDVRGISKTEKSFESTLSEVASELEKAGSTESSSSPTKSAFEKIASSSNLDSTEEALTAVRESANFLVSSRLDEKFQDSKQGKKLTAELSEYIAKDPYMHKKILGVLQKLK